ARRPFLPLPVAHSVRAYGVLAWRVHSAVGKRLAADHHSGIAPLRDRVRLHHDGDGEGAPGAQTKARFADRSAYRTRKSPRVFRRDDPQAGEKLERPPP